MVSRLLMYFPKMLSGGFEVPFLSWNSWQGKVPFYSPIGRVQNMVRLADPSTDLAH